MPPKKTQSLKEEPVAKNLRDTWYSLSSLKEHIEKTYGTHNDWADNFVSHKKAIVSLPKFKDIGQMIDRMTPEMIKGRMKYAMGDYAKPPPPPTPFVPPPERDVLDTYYLEAFKFRNKTDDERLELAKAKRAELQKIGKTPEAFVAEIKAENKAIADGAVARAVAYDAKKSGARPLNLGTVHPTTGGGRR
jgi:hypothetical protein